MSPDVLKLITDDVVMAREALQAAVEQAGGGRVSITLLGALRLLDGVEDALRALSDEGREHDRWA